MSRNWQGYQHQGGLGQRLEAIEAEREEVGAQPGGDLITRIQRSKGILAMPRAHRTPLRDRVMERSQFPAA
ncbi:MAG: hypothetical protein ACYCZN_01170 [Candidatus Dormibacteria bacterium]